MGVPRSFKEVDAVLAAAAFPNSTVEREIRAACDRVKADVIRPVVQNAQQSLMGCDDEAAELAQATAGHRQASKDLRRRIKRHEISAKEARTELDKLKREAIVLDKKREAIVAHYETELYVRDHAEEYLDVLYDRYPSLTRPQFPI
jgi:chromosome segregation ATPase